MARRDLLEDEDRFLALLESQHAFPGDFTVRVICRSRTTAELVPRAVQARTGLELGEAPPPRESAGGRYVSISVVLRVAEPRDVLRAYQALAELDGVVSYF